MTYLPIRLEPGADLRRSLEEAATVAGASTFVVSGIGSLHGSTLRMAGEQAETQLSGPFEILCLSGTVSPDGAHLHMAISNSQGVVTGGHVCYGNAVRTTAEVLLVNLQEWVLGRELDEATGFKEMVARPRGRGSDAGA